ncbi:hypothetical protein F2Q69_00018194 [Brassica cretica]|uniref:Uncharacterized protein n=1 Tax=Brassica cretica TaxID=69181 RepID=A0A8S9Q1B1_BRACR|nr:hypothetical protein F2Q69_00018194 [Brassica cretica]
MMAKLTADLRAFESGLMGPPCCCSSGGVRLGWIVGSKPYLFSVLQVRHRRLLGSALQVAASHPRILENLKEFSNMFLVFSLGPSYVDSIFASLLRHPVSFLVSSPICPPGSSFVVKFRFQWCSSEAKKLCGSLVCNLRVFRFTCSGKSGLCLVVPWWNCVIRLAFNPNKLGCIAFSINPASVSLLFTKLEVYGSVPSLCYLQTLSPGGFHLPFRLLVPRPLRLCCYLRVAPYHYEFSNFSS